MEERKNESQQGKVPSLVTTDDLVLELGKQLVDKINKEKFIDQILRRIKELEAQINSIQMSTEKRVSTLESSIKQYKEEIKKLNAKKKSNK